MENKRCSENDRALITCFIEQNDQEAFAALVHKHHSRIFQIAYGILNNREDAQEVAQDTFLRVFNSLANFRWESEFTTWIYRIVTNLALNKYNWNKSHGVGRGISLDATVDNVKGDGELKFDVADNAMLTPAESAMVDETQDRLKKAMEKLPESYRQAVILRCVKELSYEEISSILNCEIGTVKSRIARGRELLRQELS